LDIRFLRCNRKAANIFSELGSCKCVKGAGRLKEKDGVPVKLAFQKNLSREGIFDGS
jgi:hypothetical protein